MKGKQGHSVNKKGQGCREKGDPNQYASGMFCTVFLNSDRYLEFAVFICYVEVLNTSFCS